jgi:hypothetical protein
MFGSDFSSGLMWAPQAVPELGKSRRLRRQRLYFPHCEPLCDRSPFNAGKMGAGRTKAREIPHARHDFPHYCRGIQLLMANPSTCAGKRRNLAENPVPYRTIPHGCAFRPKKRAAQRGRDQSTRRRRQGDSQGPGCSPVSACRSDITSNRARAGGVALTPTVRSTLLASLGCMATKGMPPPARGSFLPGVSKNDAFRSDRW